MKKKTIAAVLAISMVTGSSLTVCAAPKTMEDGTVFDAEYYAQMYPDVVAELGTEESALYQHYVIFGRSEGRQSVNPAASASVTINSFDTLLEQAYLSYTTNDMSALLALNTNPVMEALADQLTAAGTDRYVHQLSDGTYAMAYVSEKAGNWWYFGQMTGGIRQGTGSIIKVYDEGYKRFSGVYANDYPAGTGTFVQGFSDGNYYVLTGNFNGAKLNGVYDTQVYSTEYGLTTTQNTYTDNHMALAEENAWLTENFEGDTEIFILGYYPEYDHYKYIRYSGAILDEGLDIFWGIA